MPGGDAAGDAPPAEPERHDAPLRSTLRFLPWLVLAAGATFLVFLLSLTRPGVFYSGDGGLKLLLVEQFARGELHPDLRIPVEPWVKALWDGGYFPFDWPFVFPVDGRTYAWCPLPFEYLTAPAYALLGWRGLYVWPVAGLLGVWFAVWRLCRKLELEPGWAALALFSVVFCSPITAYGAIFWEHTLGVALALTGLTLLAAQALRSPAWSGLLGGLLLGLSVWFRSELVWLAAVTAALLPFAPRLGIELRGRAAFFGGLALAGLGFLAWNASIYGDPLGMTSKLVVQGQRASISRTALIALVFPRLARELALVAPAPALAAVAALAARRLGLRDEERRGQTRLWTILATGFAIGVVLVLPVAGGDGGKQIGPRYLLVIFPMAALVLALSARALWNRATRGGRAAMGVALAIALGAGVWLNAVEGAAELSHDYEARVAPMLEALRADPSVAVVATSPFTAQEYTSLFGEKRFFRVRDPVGLVRLGGALARAGQGRFLVLHESGPIELYSVTPAGGQQATVTVRPMGTFGTPWFLNEAIASPGAAHRDAAPPDAVRPGILRAPK